MKTLDELPKDAIEYATAIDSEHDECCCTRQESKPPSQCNCSLGERIMAIAEKYLSERRLDGART